MSTFPKGEFLESVPLGIGDALLTSRPVMDGESVNAAVTNRLPKTNDANTAYIHGLIKKFHDLSGEYLWQMPITPDVKIGDVGYLLCSSCLKMGGWQKRNRRISL